MNSCFSTVLHSGPVRIAKVIFERKCFHTLPRPFVFYLKTNHSLEKIGKLRTGRSSSNLNLAIPRWTEHWKLSSKAKINSPLVCDKPCESVRPKKRNSSLILLFVTPIRKLKQRWIIKAAFMWAVFSWCTLGHKKSYRQLTSRFISALFLVKMINFLRWFYVKTRISTTWPIFEKHRQMSGVNYRKLFVEKFPTVQKATNW